MICMVFLLLFFPLHFRLLPTRPTRKKPTSFLVMLFIFHWVRLLNTRALILFHLYGCVVASSNRSDRSAQKLKKNFFDFSTEYKLLWYILCRPYFVVDCFCCWFAHPHWLLCVHCTFSPKMRSLICRLQLFRFPSHSSALFFFGYQCSFGNNFLCDLLFFPSPSCSE